MWRRSLCPQCCRPVRRRNRFCPDPRCGARIRWDADDSVELHVTGVADEVESVTRLLAAGLASSRVRADKSASHQLGVQARWMRSRKAWAFAVGLATVVGAVAAVLALVVH